MLTKKREIHVGDVGTVFEACIRDGTTVVDVSAAEELRFMFQKPSGTIVTKTATLTSTGTDGKIQYAAEVGFLSEAGKWTWQAWVKLSSSQKWHTDLKEFRVYENVATQV